MWNSFVIKINHSCIECIPDLIDLDKIVFQATIKKLHTRLMRPKCCHWQLVRTKKTLFRIPICRIEKRRDFNYFHLESVTESFFQFVIREKKKKKKKNKWKKSLLNFRKNCIVFTRGGNSITGVFFSTFNKLIDARRFYINKIHIIFGEGLRETQLKSRMKFNLKYRCEGIWIWIIPINKRTREKSILGSEKKCEYIRSSGNIMN